MSERNPLLEIFPLKIDDGELVGPVPTEVPLEILAEKFRARSPLRAIRARCIGCCCGQQTEVRKCTATDCLSWTFRMGVNPFRKKVKLSLERRQQCAEHLKAFSESAECN